MLAAHGRGRWREVVGGRQNGRKVGPSTVAVKQGKAVFGGFLWRFWWLCKVVEVMGELGGASGGSGWLKNG